MTKKKTTNNKLLISSNDLSILQCAVNCKLAKLNSLRWEVASVTPYRLNEKYEETAICVIDKEIRSLNNSMSNIYKVFEQQFKKDGDKNETGSKK